MEKCAAIDRIAGAAKSDSAYYGLFSLPRPDKPFHQWDVRRPADWYFPSESETAPRGTGVHKDRLPMLHHTDIDYDVPNLTSRYNNGDVYIAESCCQI